MWQRVPPWRFDRHYASMVFLEDMGDVAKGQPNGRAPSVR
jgi:hypothetical protein